LLDSVPSKYVKFGVESFSRIRAASLEPSSRELVGEPYTAVGNSSTQHDRISRMLLNPLDGVQIAFQRVAVSLIGKEVTELWLRKIGHSGST
jgi:hypothetical protein